MHKGALTCDDCTVLYGDYGPGNGSLAQVQRCTGPLHCYEIHNHFTTILLCLCVFHKDTDRTSPEAPPSVPPMRAVRVQVPLLRRGRGDGVPHPQRLLLPRPQLPGGLNPGPPPACARAAAGGGGLQGGHRASDRDGSHQGRRYDAQRALPEEDDGALHPCYPGGRAPGLLGYGREEEMVCG